MNEQENKPKGNDKIQKWDKEKQEWIASEQTVNEAQIAYLVRCPWDDDAWQEYLETES